MVFQIGIGMAISIPDEDRDWDRNLDFGDRGHALLNNQIIERAHYYAILSGEGRTIT